MSCNNWVTFVRTWASEKGVTYGNALKDPELKVAYNALKPVKEKKLKVVSEAEPVVEAPVVSEAVVIVEAPVVSEAEPKKKRVRKSKKVVAESEELVAEIVAEEPILEQIKEQEPIFIPKMSDTEPKLPKKKTSTKRVLTP